MSRQNIVRRFGTRLTLSGNAGRGGRLYVGNGERTDPKGTARILLRAAFTNTCAWNSNYCFAALKPCSGQELQIPCLEPLVMLVPQMPLSFPTSETLNVTGRKAFSVIW